MNQEYFYSHSFGFDQFQPPQFSDVYQTPPVASMEMLHAQTDLIESMQNFLMKYDHIPHNEKSIKLLLAEEKFLKIKQVVEEEQTQPEYLQELLQNLLKDLQILNEIQLLKQETPNLIQKDQEEKNIAELLAEERFQKANQALNESQSPQELRIQDLEIQKQQCLEEIIRDGRKKIEDMSIEEMMHEQQLVDREIKGIINDLGYKRFRGEEIDEEYERDCEIRIRKLKQDFNIWGSEVRKKEKAYEDEKYSAACRYMLSITCDDEDDYIPSGDIIARYSTSISITPDLPIQEPDNSLSMGDGHLDTTPSIKNLVPIPSEFEGMSDDTSGVPNCDTNRVNVESDFVESLINRDTSIIYSSKIDPILEEFAGELAHIAPILPGIVEADFDLNDDTSSDDDSFENIEYVDATHSYSEIDSLEEVNDDDQEEKEFDLEDILQIQDVILREKLLNISRLITNIESLKDNPIPVADSDSSDTSLSFSNNSLPEFESFSDHMEETRSGSTTTHANYSPPEYESFHFDNPSFSRPPPEPPDVEICLHFEPDAPVIDNFNELNDNQRGSEIDFSEDDDSFTFVIWIFLPFLTYPEVSPLSCSTGSEDTIFDPGIST
ncbi:hypothetical protein Tco_0211357 [Tanacetum coccineum]